MKAIFLTNQASYHQMHFAREMVQELGEDQFRIAFLKDTSAARAEMGWSDDYSEPYILRWSESDSQRQECQEWIDSSCAVIQGRFPIKHVRKRIKRGKLTFACQERLWKKPPSWLRLISRSAHLYKNYYSVNRNNYHFLAIGRYAAQDLNELGLFKNRSWKFGYFIDCPEYQKRTASPVLKLLWCARFSPVKQPEVALRILAQLNELGIDADLTMVGDGELKQTIEAKATEMGVRQLVSFTGWQSQQSVFDFMKQSDVFLMTSHHGEGWGLVVNEALSHGCAVMANEQLGSAQWLIRHRETGLLYNDDNIDEQVSFLASLSTDQIRQLGWAANQDMQEAWSAKAAARQTVRLIDQLLHNQADEARLNQSDGVCSLIG